MGATRALFLGLVLALLGGHGADASLAALSCGDNFCCIVTATNAVECWGGNDMATLSPSGSNFAMLSCSGKSCVAVDSSDTITACWGTPSYGVESCTTGDRVSDVSISFWGGCKILASDGSLDCWGQDVMYGTNGQPTLAGCTSNDCTEYDIEMSPPTGTGYTQIACGGKRAGHWCCATAASGAVNCWGAGNADFVPASSGTLSTTSPWAMSAGCDFVCILNADGSVTMEGGRSGTTCGWNDWAMSDVPTLAGPFVQAGCGTFGLYTLDSAGVVTGYGRTFGSSVGPVAAGTNVADLPAGLSASGLAMACGFGHCCVISSSGAPQCWGSDYAGQVSNAPSTVAATAYLPPKLGSAASTPTVVPVSSGSAQTITGHIFCDNQFEFYFNGQLVATDPMSFTPHQAVAVSFEWDGVSDKTYAIMCEDYASESGYEYVDSNNPQLGDGSLIAKFSDGTVTSTDWKAYTVTFGPTDASVSAGCGTNNLGACQVQDNGTPPNWYTAAFDDSSWVTPTQYTAAEAGWGRAPSWTGGQCCTVTSPADRSNVGCNVDPITGASITVTEDQCIDPQTVLNGVGADFIWGADIDRDNKMLFRHTVAVSGGSTPPSPPSPPPPSPPTVTTSPTPTVAPPTVASPTPTASPAVTPSGAYDANYGATGAELTEPPVHESSDGHLELTLTFAEFYYDGPTAQFPTRAFNGGIPAPTWKVHPGDTIRLTLVNELGPNPAVTGNVMNTFHYPNTTNMHTHGLHISGESPGDDVFRTCEPGQTEVYEYVIPDDHAGGTHWYHPHHHGSTALQVGGGAAGTILVADKAGDVPAYIADMPETLLFMQYFPIAANPSLLSIAQDSQDDLITADSFNAMNADFVLVNGLFQPQVTLEAGKWRRFRIVHSGTIATLEITLPGCDVDLLAKDGVYLRANPRRVTTVFVVAGARADVAVRCPAAGFYTMASGADAKRKRRSRSPPSPSPPPADNVGIQTRVAVAFTAAFADLDLATLDASATARSAFEAEYTSTLKSKALAHYLASPGGAGSGATEANITVTIVAITAGSVNVQSIVEFPPSSVETGSTAFATAVAIAPADVFADSTVLQSYGIVSSSGVSIAASVVPLYSSPPPPASPTTVAASPPPAASPTASPPPTGSSSSSPPPSSSSEGGGPSPYPPSPPPALDQLSQTAVTDAAGSRSGMMVLALVAAAMAHLLCY